MGLKIYNSLGRKIEEFTPLKKGQVKMYCCGPTVYWRMQIGNLRAYVNWDILHRSLVYLGYNVERVINFTDVGHMTEDDDFGEDKVESTAVKQGITPGEVADHYIGTVLADFKLLNLLHPDGSEILDEDTPESAVKKGWVRATHHVEDMIEMNKIIEANGYAYETEQALYFDVTKFDSYSELSGQKLSDKLIGVRDEVYVDPEKKNPADFVLWVKRKGKYSKHIQHWPSPWGDGFPGWHIECSAMGCKYLGEHIDIHTGGVDHIAVHHSNERAQNFGRYGHEVVRYWMHNEFVTNADGEKLSKSKGNSVTLDEIDQLGFDPLDLRYYFMSINYRQHIHFSKKALDSARNSRRSLNEKVQTLKQRAAKNPGKVLPDYRNRFKEALEDDLNMSKALSVLQDLLKSQSEPESVLATVLDFDKVLGLSLEKLPGNLDVELDLQIRELLEMREQARRDKDFKKSDELRELILKEGYEVLDTPGGQSVRPISN